MKLIIYILVIISTTTFVQSQVGINTNNPTKILDINGDLNLRKELKIELKKKEITDSKLEPLIIIQYVSEDFINSMVLLKDLNNIFYIFEELDYPELNYHELKHVDSCFTGNSPRLLRNNFL